MKKVAISLVVALVGAGRAAVAVVTDLSAGALGHVAPFQTVVGVQVAAHPVAGAAHALPLARGEAFVLTGGAGAVYAGLPGWTVHRGSPVAASLRWTNAFLVLVLAGHTL